jgi:hypothetical protein
MEAEDRGTGVPAPGAGQPARVSPAGRAALAVALFIGFYLRCRSKPADYSAPASRSNGPR